MDFDLRDWLYILGALLIAGIGIHGFWRMRRNRSEIKMALDKNYLNAGAEEVDEFSMFKAELPNGGARVVKAPDQGEVDLDQDVPVLMESVAGAVQDKPESAVSSAPDVSKAPPVTRPAATPAPQAPEKPEKFIVLYVTAQDTFDGQSLLEALVERGLAFGDMDIFHFDDESGAHVFSLVNAVEPGTFDMATMNQMQTPAISIFMRAHELSDPVAVFDEMIDTALYIADELGGQVCDESRSVMTGQTIEHLRQNLEEFQYKYSA